MSADIAQGLTLVQRESYGELLVQRDRDVDDGLIECAKEYRLTGQQSNMVEAVSPIHQKRGERAVRHRHAADEAAVYVEAGPRVGIDGQLAGATSEPAAGGDWMATWFNDVSMSNSVV